MSRVEAAAAMDRLPWLPDEPKPRLVKRRGNAVLPWAAAAIIAVGGAAFWIGTKTVDEIAPSSAQRAQPTTTVRLPEPKPIQPEVRIPAQPEIKPTPMRDLHPAPAPTPGVVQPTAQRPATKDEAAARDEEQGQLAAQRALAAPKPALAFELPKPWNPRIAVGAAGRLVQIGAFGSTPQAKRGWWYMVRAYPAVAHLPAVVRPARNSKGRAFYRFQVGTTSQAHSEVLCQRMQKIGFSCAIVGLPWKAKVER